ncbi:MAG: hypothetical protein J2P17_14865 [Mycobacterium sp.]|nr:hypothetical protein [Mycobacterium sp.]
MANILISTMPEPVHVTPFIPVASQLVRRGHHVVWHTGAAYRATVEGTGGELWPFDKTPDVRQIPVEPDPGSSGLSAGISVMRPAVHRPSCRSGRRLPGHH